MFFSLRVEAGRSVGRTAGYASTGIKEGEKRIYERICRDVEIKWEKIVSMARKDCTIHSSCSMCMSYVLL